MFKVNEFNYRINPLKPGTITLELTKKSKRNLLARQLVPTVVIIAVVAIVNLAAEEALTRSENKNANKDPEKD